jgi:uncharacterized phage protein (TIGR02218 family)
VRSFGGSLASHIASRSHRLAWGMRVERSDGDITGWTSHDRAKTVTIDATPLVLEPTNAIDISSIVREIGLGVPTLEATVLELDATMTRADLLDGVWDGAEFFIFQYNWASPSDGLIEWLSGRFGSVTPRHGSFVIELRGLTQALHNDATRILQADCDYRFGDSRCTVNLAPHTYAFEVVAVTNQRVFEIDLANPDDDFTEGELTWDIGSGAGLNAGKRRKVMSHASQIITLAEAAVRTIQVGDTGEIIRGCRKRREDCIAFANVLNYPGADLKPTRDALSQGETA